MSISAFQDLNRLSLGTLNDVTTQRAYLIQDLVLFLLSFMFLIL